MKIFPLALGLLSASIVGSKAQVTVEVILEQEQFLRDESVWVKIRITNRSGQTLAFDKETEWLTFTVESRDGFVVSRVSDPPASGAFSLESSKAATVPMDLMAHFDLSKAGRYLVAATVKIKQWNEEIA